MRFLFQLIVFFVALCFATAALAQQPGHRFAGSQQRMNEPNPFLPNTFTHPAFTSEPTAKQTGKPLAASSLMRAVPSISAIDNTVKQCQDTSLRHRYSNPSLYVANDLITRTRDDNILIPGWQSVPGGGYRVIPHLLKVTPQGDTLWTRVFDIGLSTETSDLYRAFELKDGSILLAGNVNLYGMDRHDMLLVKLSAAGDFIWQRSYLNSYWFRDTTGGQILLGSCTEDNEGNAYLCGDIWWFGGGRGATAFKIDTAGNMVWSKNYYPDNSSGFTGIDYSNNTLKIFGFFANNYSSGILGLGVDPATGDTLWSKAWNYTGNLPNYYRFSPDAFTKLNNGNYALYGYNSSGSYIFDSSQLTTHYGMAEFTPDFDFVKGMVFRSAIATAYGQRLTVFEDGSMGYTRGYDNNYPSSLYNANLIIGICENGGIVKERTIPFRGTINSWTSNMVKMSDGGQIISFYDIDSVGDQSSIEMMRLHNSDTSGSCVGSDTAATIVETMQFSQVPVYIDSITDYAFLDRTHPFNGVLTSSLGIENGCQQVSHCDTLSLKADRTTLCPGTPVTLSIHKNKACGAFPAFSYDTTAVQSFVRTNDTTLSLTFRKSWQGVISAAINGCRPLSDSVAFTVLEAPAALNIGPDTVICPGNTVALNARSGYASYRWQDGSKDSLFTITKPGKYFVTTTNACGGMFSDTVVAASHPPIAFNIGPDVSLCEGDTITVTAPAGFINYQWSPASGISSVSNQAASLFPLSNTRYTVTAELTPGCFALDSFDVAVKTVPPLYIGNDTTLCEGNSLTVSAGAGFSTYRWNNGATTPSVIVNAKGAVSVQATINGCTAADTLVVTDVYPLPLFSLGNDTTLCEGTSLPFDFHLAGASYLWSDGSTANTTNITLPGTYHLQVVQNGCQYADTVTVGFQPAPVLSLGNDTLLCEGTTLLLQTSLPGALLRWQDGSSSPSYLVKQEGLYTLTAALGNCATTDSLFVSYKPLPAFTLGKDTFICLGQSLVLRPLLNVPVNYLWGNGSKTAAYTATTSGTYWLTATGDCGSYTDSISVISGICQFSMPSAFTPGHDGVNDVFRVKYPFPARAFRLVIFSRWGQKVYETSDMSKGWNGNINSFPASADTYIWQIRYTDMDGKPYHSTGTVVLFR